jgi:hypothetical protein
MSPFCRAFSFRFLNTISEYANHENRRWLPKMASAGDARLLKSTRFPPEFSQKVDMKKVNLQVMKKLVMILPVSSAGLLQDH